MMKKNVCNTHYQHFFKLVLVVFFCLPFGACVANTSPAKEGSPTFLTATKTLKPTSTIRAELTYTPTNINLPTKQSQLGKTVTITVTQVPRPIIQTDYSALPTGQYLVYFEFLNASTVNAVAQNGKVYVLSSQPASLLAVSANGRYFLFPEFVYDYRKQAQTGVSPTQSCTDASISFDGRKFVASNCPKETIAIRAFDQDWIRLNDSDVIGGQVRFPSWSPDGKQIAFVNCKSGQYITEDSGIYVADVDACFNEEKECVIKPKGPYLRASCPQYIAWSPDGQFIAGSDDELRIVNLKTKQEKTIIDAQPGTGLLHGIAWSPNGKWIGYAVDNVGPNAENSSLYIVPSQGGKPILLNPNTSAQVWAWLNVIPEFKVGNKYTISIMGEGSTLREEPTLKSMVVKTLHQNETIELIDGPVYAENQTWWKMKFGSTSGWIVEKYDWFTTK